MAKDTRGHYREHVFRVFQGIGDAVMMVMGQPWPTIGCGEMYFFCRLGASVFFFRLLRSLLDRTIPGDSAWVAVTFVGGSGMIGVLHPTNP
jgi:hypothetical protein